MISLFAASDCPESAEASVVLTDDEEIAGLNRAWRDVDGPTDVLSFSMREGEGGAFIGDMLGDIIISVETAARQADEAEHRDRIETGRRPWTLDDEITFLTIHGLLHLLGHDHYDPEEERQMKAAEQRLWDAVIASEGDETGGEPTP